MGKISMYQFPAYNISQFTETRISEEHPETQTFPLIVISVIKSQQEKKNPLILHPPATLLSFQDNKLFKILCFNSYDIVLLLLLSIYTSSSTIPGTVDA